MTLTGLRPADPFQQVFVSIDLETTGLNPHGDTIIEVGAIKFRGGEVLERFQTFVNPGRRVPQFIQQLTSISPSQLERAPSFGQIADRLAGFLADYPLVGHNVKFDLDFLESHNLPLANRSYNTWDLATVFLPSAPEYNLSALAQQLDLDHSQAHRADADAEVTAGVFHRLLEIGARQPAAKVALIARAARAAGAPVADLLDGLIPHAAGANAPLVDPDSAQTVGLNGLNLASLSNRMSVATGGPLGAAIKREVTEQQVEELLSPHGLFAQAFPGFEDRPQQTEMLKAVTRAIYQGRKLIVEGGTGIGKSLAYLLPAVVYAATHGQRVVISTNTINLQEQLMNKDIPAVIGILEAAGILHPGVVKAAQLKGRSNYVCLHRWNNLALADAMNEDEARVIGKTAVWLDDTATGDRTSLNLHFSDLRAWSRISADTPEVCPAFWGSAPCFLRQARQQAEEAHILVVNHALLLADLAVGGTVLQDYERLIIDEAHHLEDEASRQLGFEVLHDALPRELESARRVLARLALVTDGANNASASCNAAEQAWERLWFAVTELYRRNTNQPDNSREALTLDDKIRQSREWGAVAMEWESASALINECVRTLQDYQRQISRDAPVGSPDTGAGELVGCIEAIIQLNDNLSTVFGRYDSEQIQWLDMARRTVAVHSTPLAVGPILRESLYANKATVVLTGATLATDSNFDFFRNRVGFPDESDELQVNSPFNYERNTLLMIPQDLPDPRQSADLNQATAQVILNLARALDGHLMALFTSHNALREASYQVRGLLRAEGIAVLAQGIDGTPRQIADRLRANPRSVLLGAASFWEGVDMDPGVLRGLLLCRLPFAVPTDPIVKARGNLWNNPFNDFQVPTAMLRFRQGFGRLIRNKTDRGVVVILDRRIQTANYGDRFLDALPTCSFQPSSMASVGQQAARWLQLDRASHR